MSRSTPFHLVDSSPWPIMASFSSFMIVSGLCDLMWSSSLTSLLVASLLVSFVSYSWWRDISREAGSASFHTTNVQKNLMSSMIWFISSEVLFFFGFFWSFFYLSVSSCVEMGFVWPPISLEVLNPLSVPLVNTIVLLGSSVSVTWAHYSLLGGDFWGFKFSMIMTLLLSSFFTLLQVEEYMSSSFTVSDSSYSSVFFMATSFHSFHVLVSTLFLFFAMCRIIGGQSSWNHHVSFECAAWYWHFVDTVWIYLYSCLYWWGSY